MKITARVLLRAVALAAAFAAATTATSASAIECYQNHKCEHGWTGDYCWVGGGTGGYACYMSAGGSCFDEEGQCQV